MKEERIHTLILGAGPSGLAAAYTLARAGCKPVMIERSKFAGGLMRSIHHGDFIMDVGRKELYNRLAKIDDFWGDLLGEDYRPYPHRGGVLYEGRIVDALPNYQGFRRGMPWSMLVRIGLDFFWWRMRPQSHASRNLEEQFYRQRGRLMTRVFSQGFHEKLSGQSWADISVEESETNNSGPGLFSTLREALERAFSRTEPNTFEGAWRHPLKGTGQICELLEQGAVDSGGRFEYQSQITGVEASETKFQAVTVETQTDTIRFIPEHVITSIPINFLVALLEPDRNHGTTPTQAPLKKNTVVLVYLFLDEPPRFPQTYLHVTSPETRIGRITNYSAYGGAMVPDGKTCLCCELYCFGDDSLLALENQEIADLVLRDCADAKLVDSTRSFDSLVLRFPGADASQNKDNWMNLERLKMQKQLEPYQNVYSTNRTELDLATLAGIEAAEAIISGNRTDFDRRFDPAELEIRSESKAFAFT